MKNLVSSSHRIRITAAIITLCSLSYYLVVTKWNLIELWHFALGITLLWLPFGSVFYIVLKRQVKDKIIRLAFSAIASYTLTTLIYFGLAVLQLENLFYLGQVAIFLGLIVCSIRQKFWVNIHQKTRRWWRFDWVLAVLISLSLVVNIPYQMPWEYSPKTGAYTLTLYQDHLYYTGLSYELARHVPPQQHSTRAGIPERAYHMFPHLTTMLLSRFTGQTDMLRVSIVYHYIIIEIGMCLALYSIAKTLTKSRLAGYIATGMMYIVAISYPPLVNNNLGYFYFTVFPHVSSGIEPAILTSPQTYSGMLVAYGVLLGVLLISLRFHRKQPADVVLIITAIMVAATIRFRIQVFLPMLPGFLLLAGYGWKHTRHRAYLVAASLALVLVFSLYLEMRSPNYLSANANLRFGFNGLTTASKSFFNSWPFSLEFHTLLSRIITNLEILKAVWQIISISAFVVLNIIGVPLLIFTGIYLSSKPARQEFLLFSCLIVWMTVASTLGGMCLKTDVDSYAVGGEMLFLPRWYLFLLMIAGIWPVYRFLQHHLHWTRSMQMSAMITLIVLSMVAQHLTRPSLIMSVIRSARISLYSNERTALAYIHDSTPPNSVILTNKYVDQYSFLVSGLAGRAAYLETVDGEQQLANRWQHLKDLWATSESKQFCQLLTATPATHLIEFSNHSLLVHNPSCMQQVWVSSNTSTIASSETVTVWKVNR
jgi:hypothetical protein